ncbi:DUF4235 domain-containing protein [Arsenicicoccus dermatophilus]|uniref:DUF4235 domain-containing protein n=1 Tax=Arsenicicoccus dermatophilus TaxID=1076331 RepID=UPI00391730A9
MGPNLWKLIGTGAAALAGVVANKIVNTSWQKATGKEAPSDPTNPEVDWKEALAFAALSGVVMGVARLVAQRQTAKGYVAAVKRQSKDIGEVDPQAQADVSSDRA